MPLLDHGARPYYPLLHGAIITYANSFLLPTFTASFPPLPLYDPLSRPISSSLSIPISPPLIAPHFLLLLSPPPFYTHTLTLPPPSLPSSTST